MVDKLSSSGAKVVGLDIALSEDEYNPGLAELKRLQDRYQGLLSARAVTDKKKVFDLECSSAMVHLDSDSKLEASLRGQEHRTVSEIYDKAAPGAAPSLAKLRALMTVLEMRLSYLEAVTEHTLARARLERSVGRDLTP